MPSARVMAVAGGVIADLSDAQVEDLLAGSPELTVEELSAEMQPVKTVEVSRKVASPSVTLPWNYEQCGLAWFKEMGVNGQGMHLGVIAQNYAYAHAALNGRVKTVQEFGLKPPVQQPAPQRSVNDLHLLHPLGIFGGFDGGRFHGVAPEADISLAVLSAKPTKVDTFLEALEWLMQLPEPPHAILICTDFFGTAPAAVARALFACRNAGIIPIIAAGNNPNSITGLAALPCCITVAASDRWKQRALFSGQGPVTFEGQKIVKPDFCEPGSAVMGPTDAKDYRLGSGTLQAAAHFAGIYLLTRQILPDADPEIILNAMRLTAQDIADQGIDDMVGYGLPVPAAAVNYIMNPPTDSGNAY
ncbi:MAG TPA: S8 family serine peptidase [Candidatus Ozemobacteraceae bacterium]|nr:S8 family serine peptidase [Candidatus Ozemobacteraceae bacterium]